ncbi:bifunctional riboflavin kinase/FMN adenylyltransferase [Tessaracoccus sp. HDW20]|nr:bifunctional riboflavin kinase/FMN adenylyltransferase [Tessaracoccus coleopterorum]
MDHLPLVVVTFWPHPVTVLRPDLAPKLLTDLRTRIELLKEAGAHEVRVVRFGPEVAGLTPAEFVERFLIPLHPVRVVVGENFRFGHRASGDVKVLAELGAGRFEVHGMPLATVDEQVSCSSGIRDLLAAGDVAEAAKHLDRPFRFRGVVVVGDQRGRELGFPTANLSVPSDLAVPADGVYAGWVTRLDEPGAEPMAAAISVGTNPTFDGADHRVESYVIDRTDLELYGVEIAVDFVARLRGQVRFDGVDGLISQMKDDVEAACAELGITRRL